MSDLETTARRPVRIWLLAAIGAVALHTGALALAVATLQPDDAPDELGANAIEVGYERTAPRTEPVDLPAGPDSEASAASPEVVEQKEVVKEIDLPKATPTETEDPDRIVSPDDKKKPDENEPDVPQRQQQASTAAAATEATAAPSSETVTASTRSVAPELGTGDSLRRVRTTWEKELSAHLNKHKRYPSDRMSRSADIVISFQLDRVGHVLSTSVVKSSGDRSFDDAAVAMMRRSDPVPAPPPLVADEGLTFTMAVNFHEQRRK